MKGLLLIAFASAALATDCSAYDTQKETCLSNCCVYCNSTNVCADFKSDQKFCAENDEEWIMPSGDDCINWPLFYFFIAFICLIIVAICGFLCFICCKSPQTDALSVNLPLLIAINV